MAETRETPILLDEETAVIERLKTGWRYRLVPVLFGVAWVFGELLFGVEADVSMNTLIDPAFILCSIWVIILSLPLQLNGMNIDKQACGNFGRFDSIFNLIEKRKKLFISMSVFPLIILVLFYILPLVGISLPFNVTSRFNSLAIIWFITAGSAGFRECDKIIPILKKAGRL